MISHPEITDGYNRGIRIFSALHVMVLPALISPFLMTATTFEVSLEDLSTWKVIVYGIKTTYIYKRSTIETFLYGFFVIMINTK